METLMKNICHMGEKLHTMKQYMTDSHPKLTCFIICAIMPILLLMAVILTTTVVTYPLSLLLGLL